MINPLLGIFGILLLAFGRKLFWLFVGCVGFVLGMQLAQRYLGMHPEWLVWTVALLSGIIGAVLAVFLQSLAIGVGGFAAGVTITSHLAVLTGFSPTPVVSIMGGVIGVVLLYLVFDWALIFLSSVAGASLVVQSLHWDNEAEIILYGGMIAAGILFQAALLKSKKYKETKTVSKKD